MTATVLLAGFAPSVAFATGADLSASLPNVPQVFDVVATSGTRILAQFSDAYWLSTNSGTTWTTANLPLTPCAQDADNCEYNITGVDSGVVAVTRNSTVAWYSLVSNAEVGTRYTGASEPESTYGNVAVFADGTGQYKFVRSNGQTWTLAASAVGGSLDGIFADGSVLDDVSDDDMEHLVRVAPDGSKKVLVEGETGSITYPDRTGWGIGGNLLAYTKIDASESKVCLVDAAALVPVTRCAGLPSGAVDGWPSLVTSDGVLLDAWGDLFFAPFHGGVLMPAVPVKVPTSAESDVTDFQDAQGPVLSLADSQRSWLARVNDSGGLTELSAQSVVAIARVAALALTPTSLVGSEGRHFDQWSRSIGSSLGAQRSIAATPWRASVVASAGRWAVPQGDSVRLLDNDGTSSREITGETDLQLSRLSGPYLLGNRIDTEDSRLWSPTGGWKTTSAEDLFGSLVLEPTSGNSFTVRDLTGVSAPVPAVLPAGDYDVARIWGDWLAATHYGDTSDEVTVKNYRTGAVKSHPGSLCAMGDGAVVLSRWIEATETNVFEVWDFVHNTVTPLTGDFDYSPMFAIDGSRLAYNTATKLVVKQLAGIGASAPRTLGVVAPASFDPSKTSWTADIDLTKPVKAGVLRITTTSGAEVRTIPVPASNTGSLRGITWNGRASSGELVPTGAYTYTLTSADADGAVATAVDGTHRALGTVQVTGLQIAGSIPVINTPTGQGAPAVGSLLTAVPGVWAPAPVALGFQWRRGSSPIPGATSSTYTASPADVSATITVTVTGSKVGYPTVSKTSLPTAKVALGTLSAGTPTVTGTAAVGATLTARPGLWGPGTVTQAYRWNRNGTPITGATSATHVVVVADAGAKLSVTVTGSRAGYASVSRTSAQTVAVPRLGFTQTPQPKISGTVKVGSTLTAKPGTWAPSADQLTYTWKRNGAAIGAASTKDSYTLAPADAGKAITVTVTATKTGYADVSRTSASTAKVKVGSISALAPTISGKAQVGQTLEAVQKAAWKPITTAMTYQWYRSGKKVKSAKAKQYTLTASDLGKKMTVKVTGTNAGYAAVSVSSKATAKVQPGTLVAVRPTISGTAQVGAKLTVNTGVWRPSGVRFTYQWYRAGKAISKATKATYTPTAADEAKTLSVKVKGVKTGYKTVTVTSAATAKVGPKS